MNGAPEILTLLGACVPFFSALIWMLMVGLSVRDSRNRLERQIKTIVLWLYVLVVLDWTFMLLYTYAPQLSIYFHLVGYLAFMLVPVQLYRYICELSETDKFRPFSLWHYALPLLIVSVLGVWSFFVPWGIQVGLLESRGQISLGYPAYSRLFLFKPQMKVIYTVVYTGFSLVRLWRYYGTIGKQIDKKRKPAHWITGLMSFVVMMLLVTIISILLPREEVLISRLVLAMAVLHIGEYFIIGYNVIRRNFLLYIPSAGKRLDRTESSRRKRIKADRAEQPAMEIEIEQSSHTGVKLTKKRFENYIDSRKLWLDPNIRMTDLVEPLETSRTSLSNFINKTYGVNFNRYINRLRLAELERLLALPSNTGKTPDDLLYKAGFASKRNYTRTLEAERNGNTDGSGKPASRKEAVK